MYPIAPTQEAAVEAYAPEFVPYLRYKEYLQNVLDAKMAAKRSERDVLASQVYQEAADAARARQGWLEDYEAHKTLRQREAWQKHFSGPVPVGWKEGAQQQTPSLANKGVNKVTKQQQLFSVQDFRDAGDSEAEAMMDPSHPSGFWGSWVDGARPDGVEAHMMRVPSRSSSKLSRKHSKVWRTDWKHAQGLSSTSHLLHAKRGKAAKQSLASVDLGQESDAEALMDPLHPTGPWGTWVEPSTSARSIIGEKEYQAYVGDASGLGNLLDRNSVKGPTQSLAAVDLGSESYAEALMDPSHPSGPWGTWVEPGASAKTADVSALAATSNNIQKFKGGQAVIAAAVAHSDHNGFGIGTATGLGGRFGGRSGGAKAGKAESFVFNRLLDSSTA